MKNLLLQILYPKKCLLCRRILDSEEENLCPKCQAETEKYPYAFLKFSDSGKFKLQFLDSFTAVWYYEGKVRDSLHRFKFSAERSYGRRYGQELSRKLASQMPPLDGVTWAPVSAKRRRKRGYDQSELIAREVSNQLNLPIYPFLQKVRNNPPQSGENAEQRRGNVLGVYEIRGNPAGKRLLLIDDILTTGATASECARMLKTAGAAEVHCAVVAVTKKKKQES